MIASWGLLPLEAGLRRAVSENRHDLHFSFPFNDNLNPFGRRILVFPFDHGHFACP
jgi:hypothetical protein